MDESVKSSFITFLAYENAMGECVLNIEKALSYLWDEGVLVDDEVKLFISEKLNTSVERIEEIMSLREMREKTDILVCCALPCSLNGAFSVASKIREVLLSHQKKNKVVEHSVCLGGCSGKVAVRVLHNTYSVFVSDVENMLVEAGILSIKKANEEKPREHKEEKPLPNEGNAPQEIIIEVEEERQTRPRRTPWRLKSEIEREKRDKENER